VIGRVEIETRGRVVVAKLIGEVDLSNVDEISSAIAEMISPETRGLVLDLTSTTYLDSTGIRMVFHLGRRLQERRHDLRLVADRGSLVYRVLSITEMEEVVAIDPSLDDALGALQE
jgi:anti-sigma B factor antagonist